MSTMTDQELVEAAQRCADAYAQLANQMFAGCHIEVPVNLNFTLHHIDPRSAGTACGLNTMNLNMPLYRENPDHILNKTIPHETGHLVVHQVFRHILASIKPHGPEWHEIMRRLGKVPAKYHELDCTNAVLEHKAYKKAQKAAKKADEDVSELTEAERLDPLA